MKSSFAYYYWFDDLVQNGLPPDKPISLNEFVTASAKFAINTNNVELTQDLLCDPVFRETTLKILLSAPSSAPPSKEMAMLVLAQPLSVLEGFVSQLYVFLFSDSGVEKAWPQLDQQVQQKLLPYVLRYVPLHTLEKVAQVSPNPIKEQMVQAWTQMRQELADVDRPDFTKMYPWFQSASQKHQIQNALSNPVNENNPPSSPSKKM